MKSKLDECIPATVAEIFTSLGHNVHTVHQEDLCGAADEEIWQAVQAENRFLVTTDLDFSDVRKYIPGSHQGILLLRLTREGQNAMHAVIQWIVEHYEMAAWKGALVVASEHKLRIRRK